MEHTRQSARLEAIRRAYQEDLHLLDRRPRADNDGVDDSSGETQLINLGKIFEVR